MKKILTMLLAASMTFALAACSGAQGGTDASGPGDESYEGSTAYLDYLMEGKNLTDSQKRVLASFMFDADVSIGDGETYKLEVPFEADEISYETDRKIIKISDDGTITPLSDGSCIVTTKADDTVLYTVVTVSGTGNENSSDPYSEYMGENMDTAAIKDALERYASIEFGMTVKDSLADGNEPVKEKSFTIAAGHDGCRVKYTLLTTICSLHEEGYKSIALRVSSDGAQLTCQFFAE